jgi:hypothetical protein
MNVEQFLECELTGETEVPGENPPQCHYDNQESHMNWSRIEPSPPRWEAGDEFCDTAYLTMVRKVLTFPAELCVRQTPRYEYPLGSIDISWYYTSAPVIGRSR